MNVLSSYHLSQDMYNLRGVVLRFSKFNNIFFGYFDPEIFILDNKNK